MMQKLDLKKLYKPYYTAKNRPELRQIESARYLSILGKGDPGSQGYADKVQALFATTYGVKFAYKAEGKDFVVAKLEGLWWFDETQFGTLTLGDAPRLVPRSEWHWRMMIRMPEYVKQTVLESIKEQVVTKKGIVLAQEVKLFTRPAEQVVQMMHIGPFEQEIETLTQIKAFMDERGLQKAGLHHEIYLSDIKRAAPEKWKTILREPAK